MNIGDLLFALGVDGSTLERDVTKEAQKAGDAGAKTLTQRMSSALKGGGGKVLAGAFAGAAAAATAGALQMEDAVARIRSETGLSQAQAEQIAKSSNQIAGDQQQSLAAVTDVAIAIKKNMGATGDQLDKLTEQTVKYARVTKQDGVGAVKAFDDIVDAFGLSLDQVGQVQDQLIVSNQKYGGSIEENQAALAAMAPQLKALNLDYNDGIELLNLFAASGLDAADGQKALNSAITKLPPGESLDQFVKRLSQVKDDGDRARLAMDVFGKKAGAKLANAIKPGIDSLDQFGVSAAQAAGATSKAVDDLDSSIGGRLRKALSQAKAALRGFGADFGPAITAAASVGSLATALGLKIPLGPLVDLGKKLGGKIAEGLGAAIVGQAGQGIVADSVATSVEGAAKSGRLSSALGVLGRFMGSTLGKAAAAGFALALLYAAEEEWKKGANEFFKLPEDAGQSDRNNAILDRLRAAGAHIDGPTMGPIKIDPATFIGPLQTAGEQGGKRLVEAAVAGAKAEAPRATASMGNTLAQQFTSHGKAWIDSAHAVAMRAMGAVAQGIIDARAKPADAMAQLVEMMKHPLRPMGEVAHLFGQLIGKKLQEGLHSKDPAIRAQAQYTKQIIIDRLRELDHQTGPLGRKAAEEVRKGLKSKDPDVRAAAQRLANRLPEAIRNKTGATASAARSLGATAARNIKAGFGTPTVTLTIKSVYDERGGHRAVGGPVIAGTPYVVNEHTANSEVFVPSTSGRILTHAEAINAMHGGGGPTINVTVNPGNDVSPVSAHRFGRMVSDEVAAAFKQGGARRGITTSVRP